MPEPKDRFNEDAKGETLEIRSQLPTMSTSALSERPEFDTCSQVTSQSFSTRARSLRSAVLRQRELESRRSEVSLRSLEVV